MVPEPVAERTVQEPAIEEVVPKPAPVRVVSEFAAERAVPESAIKEVSVYCISSWTSALLLHNSNAFSTKLVVLIQLLPV